MPVAGRCSRRCATWSAPRTCSPTPTWSPATSSTGPAGSAGSTPAVVRPGDRRRGRRRCCARATSGGAPRRPAGRQHRPRRRLGAAARRDRARPAPARRARARRPAGRPGHRAGRRDDRAPAGARARARAGSTASISRRATSRPSAARSRPTRAACTCCATGRPAARCSASKPCSPTVACIRRLDGLEKDNTGYDLAGLLCGSEGTLAVITAARLRLVPRPDVTPSSRCSPSTTSMPRSTRSATLRRDLDSLQAVELFFQDGLDLVCDRLGLARPVRRPPRRVRAGRGGRATPIPTEALARGRRRAARASPTSRSPPTTRRRATLWRYREAHTEAINLLGAPHKLDVTLAGRPARRVRREVADAVRRGRAGRSRVVVRSRG